MHPISIWARLVALALTLLAAACTTLSDADRALLAQAQRDAQAAKEQAAQAEITARQALDTAQSAQMSANQAADRALHASADAKEASLKAQVLYEQSFRR